MFGNVPTSFFSLFQVTTIDEWNVIADPVVKMDTTWRFFFVTFIAFASWTMISVLTAVASDSMIAATSDKKDQELKEQEKKQRLFITFLRDSFYEADTDGNGLLDTDEFQAMINNDFVYKQMKALGIHLTKEEMLKAWEMLDVDESGELTIDEFVTGLAYLQERLSAMHVVNVDYNLKRTTARINKKMADVWKLIEHLSNQNQEVRSLLLNNEQLRKQQQLYLWLWRRWAHKYGDRQRLAQMPPIPLEALPLELQKLHSGLAG